MSWWQWVCYFVGCFMLGFGLAWEWDVRKNRRRDKS